MKGLVSIIIRTRNEERWIVQCLRGVFAQTYTNFEVILVDNESTDRTIEKARQFKLAKVVTCTDYLPGKALNLGIREAAGEFIVCLSGHCIPVNDQWLENLIRNFDDSTVAGVYGRQEPMAFTPDSDKRDLILVFGLDRKVQLKDDFFHNANSMIRRDVWEKVPFDDHVRNIEDRLWGKSVLQLGYKMIYEPEASVYHHHGIHQDGDITRCASVVRIIESIKGGQPYRAIDIEKLNVVAIIPVRGAVQYLNGRPLLEYTIEAALASRHINQVIVSTDSEELAAIAREAGAEVPFMRDPALSVEHVDILRVLQYSLQQIEDRNILPDLVVSLEVTFPFRPANLLDEMIARLAEEGLDSIVAARRENRAIWKERNEKVVLLDDGLTPRAFKDPTFIELRGVGCVTHPEFIRDGRLLGDKTGLYELENPYSHIDVRSEQDLVMASYLMKEWRPVADNAVRT